MERSTEMSALYQINRDMLDCIDEETGEILDIDRLSSLRMEKYDKVRNIACWIKNLIADAKDYEDEEKVFAHRKTVARNKAESLKAYLAAALNGEKINAREFTIGWRKSQSVDIKEGADIPPAYLIPVPDKVDKIGLKDALKKGCIFPGIRLIERNNIQVK